MPELPEVENIKRGLERKILNKTIVDIKINKKKLIKEPSLENFKKGLIGEAAKKIYRRAKLLIIQLKKDKFLIVHLRISGWFLYGNQEEKARVIFKFSDGTFLNYMDQRLLGELRLRKDYQNLAFLKNLGPEPFEINLEEFKKVLKNKKTKIKPLLLDQSVVSGIGNIYAQEILFLAGIDPQRPAGGLGKDEIKLLYEKMISVLREAIKYKGSSVDSYRDLEGNKGGMEERLKVYSREGKPCFVCKKTIKRIVLGGRGTCFCPYCQR